VGIELRKTGIEVLGDIPWGSHFCHFYETKEDLLDILIPYFKTGLENNEFCMWIVFDPLDVQSARNALRPAIPEADLHLAAGDIEIVPHTHWYLKNGVFDLNHVIHGWRKKLAEALEKGFTGMRVNGNEAWLTEKDWKNFAAYEKRLNELIADKRMIVLCTYPLAVTRAAELFDVARTHQFAIARRHGNWEVVETPELKQAKTEIERLNIELEQRVIARSSQLAKVNEELGREIMERKRAEAALKISEEELRKLFAAMTDVALVLDSEGRYVKIAPTNPVNLYGPSEELVGKKVHDILPEEDADEIIIQIQRSLKSRQTINYEYKLNIGSREVWFDSRVTPLTENTVFWIARDITERKQLEDERARAVAQLRQAQKMESVGRLAGGVAHDLNNLLTPILGYGEMLQEDIAPNDVRRNSVDEIVKAANRTRDIIRQLLTFSRKQVIAVKLTDLNQVVKGFEKLLRRTIREDIEIRVVHAPDLPTVNADIGQIEQVIMNLAVNAQDAMPHGGVLTIRTEPILLDQKFCTLHPGSKPGRHAMLEVSDTGVGMDHGTAEQIFEPFFTTKGEHGTGLGLATVYGIVMKHDGYISVDSRLGEGTIFRIYIPAADSTTTESTQDVTRPKAMEGKETVLVVEDSDQILALANRILSRQGYEVLVAANGTEGLEKIKAHDGRVHLILTDVVMPDMNGRELFEKASSLCPSLKVLYMSGYSGDVLSQRGVLENGIEVISKPFSVSDLSAKVRAVLDKK
jgi:PAS domain S-box-containing protein